MATETAIEIINSLIIESYAMHASDIHINPKALSCTVRYRIDGTLKDIRELPKIFQSELLTRLKVLTGIRTDEHNKPHDGRFCFDISNTETIDIRVSIAPTYYGENAVLRLLSSTDSLSTLTSLGMSANHQDLVLRALERPHGMILITCPTGSGKTSTLYAFLHIVNTRSCSIITIEDPIEYAIAGITQIPAGKNTGLSFSEGLRSILRQDPNIIGVGEIRDHETASLATNAALTGHLVLTTLHTSDAPTSLPRLIDMQVEPYLISSTVNIVINQRLVKRLCQTCKKKKAVRKDQKSLISLIPGPTIYCNEQFESLGCNDCQQTGVSGRIAIFEILIMNTSLREAVTKKTSGKELYTLALEQGMLPLLHDGIRKAAEGSVSLDEILLLMSE
jgi:type IV pilus assembly protein PilB